MEKWVTNDIQDEILAAAAEEEEEEEKINKSEIWDCQSSLYDSFELNSFKRQLESAISSSSFSSIRKPVVSPVAKPVSRISKSIRKLVRTVFKVKPTVEVLEEPPSSPLSAVIEGIYNGRCLETIQEEKIGYHDESDEEIKSSWVVRRTASERWFAGRRAGMMCR